MNTTIKGKERLGSAGGLALHQAGQEGPRCPNTEGPTQPTVVGHQQSGAAQPARMPPPAA